MAGILFLMLTNLPATAHSPDGEDDSSASNVETSRDRPTGLPDRRGRLGRGQLQYDRYYYDPGSGWGGLLGGLDIGESLTIYRSRYGLVIRKRDGSNSPYERILGLIESSANKVKPEQPEP